MVLHPAAAAAIAEWSQAPSVSDLGYGQTEIDLARKTARMEAAAQDREHVALVSDLDAGGVTARWYVPTQEHRSRGAVLFAHGGGFVFGDTDTHDAQSRRIANRTGLAVLSVDYRRAPEHLFPTAHDDVATAALWLREHSAQLEINPRALVALGDSAGASLAVVAALRHPLRFAAVVSVYPFLDPNCRGASYETEGECGFSPAEARWFWQAYAGSVQTPHDLRTDPTYCPLEDPRLGELPPTLVQVAEHDILRDEAVLLADRIGKLGGIVETQSYPGMIHGFWCHPDRFDAAETAYADMAAFLTTHLPQG